MTIVHFLYVSIIMILAQKCCDRTLNVLQTFICFSQFIVSHWFMAIRKFILHLFKCHCKFSASPIVRAGVLDVGLIPIE